MSQIISFDIQDDQIVILKEASLTEGVDFTEEARRIFERGLQATKSIIEGQQASKPVKDPRTAELEANGAFKNAQEFSAIVSSNAFRERFASEIAKPKI